MNAREYVEAALRKIRVIGRGRAMTAEEGADGLQALNVMLRAWSGDGLTIPYRTVETLTLTAGTNPHTIGSGGTLNTTQPLEIHTATVIDGTTSYDLTPMMADEYARIGDKTVQSIPGRYYFETGLTLGSIYFDFVPSSAYSFRLASVKALTGFTTLDTDDSLPERYDEAVLYNLAIRLAPEFGKDVDRGVAVIASGSLFNLRSRNSADRIPVLQYDAALTGRGTPFDIDAGNY